METTETEGLYRQTIAVYWSERGRLTFDALTEYRYLPTKEQ